MKEFIQELIRKCRPLKDLKSRDVVIFNVRGNYGHYQIRLGPLNTKAQARSVEINGEIHHLFVSKDHVEPVPTHEEINKNMRGTVIMSDISIHIFDEKGDGHAVKIGRMEPVHAKNQINLAGNDGEKILNEFESSGRLANDTYQIVQEDILKSL